MSYATAGPQDPAIVSATQTCNKNTCPKTGEGKEIKIFGEKAVNTIQIKGQEVSGAHGYKDHCRLFNNSRWKTTFISLFVYTGGTNSLPTRLQIIVQRQEKKWLISNQFTENLTNASHFMIHINVSQITKQLSYKH